jgi:glycosyltransferase involved in cell wall biosynthesis
MVNNQDLVVDNNSDPTATLSKSSYETNQKNKTVVALIPAYNESENIGSIIKETQRYVTSIIVIDDGSTDNTGQISASLSAKVIRNKRRIGKGAALKKGFIECLKSVPNIVVTLDADGQHNPEEIPKLLQPIENDEADIVIGSRYSSNTFREMPVMRRLGLLFINKINKYLTRTTVKDSQSGFRAYSKNVLRIMTNFTSTGYGVETEQLAIADSLGCSITEVPVTINYHGLKNTSKQNSFLHGLNIISTILRVTVERRPLLFFGLPGCILTVLAIASGVDMLLIFNNTRYFSIPLALVTLGLVSLGSLLTLISFILYVLAKMRSKESQLTE